MSGLDYVPPGYEDQPRDADMALRAVRFTDGTGGVEMAVELGDRHHVMTMTPVQALIEAGRLETTGELFFCLNDSGGYVPIYLDRLNAKILAAGLRAAVAQTEANGRQLVH